jgi:hypothetical protein
MLRWPRNSTTPRPTDGGTGAPPSQTLTLPLGAARSQARILGDPVSSSFTGPECGFDSRTRPASFNRSGVAPASVVRPSLNHTQTGVECRLPNGVFHGLLRVRGARVEGMAPAKTMPMRKGNLLESNQTTRGTAGRGLPRISNWPRGRRSETCLERGYVG